MKKKMAVLFLLLAAGLGSASRAEETKQEAQTDSWEKLETVSENGNESQVASADEMAAPEQVVSEDMVPIGAEQLKEGTYEVEVLSSSSMFKIASAQLTVEDGKMQAALTIASDSYEKLFLGTGAEAVAADESDWIFYETDAEGNQVYTLPIEALDQGIDCAAWSRRKEKWYDRILVVCASSLPGDAFLEGGILTAEELGLKDGSYTAEVTLGGASGKTALESPAELIVENGAITAILTFNSTNYDYVIIDGERYELLSEDGNSSFAVSAAGFDWDLPIKADSVALGKARELDYTIRFDSASLQETGEQN